MEIFNLRATHNPLFVNSENPFIEDAEIISDEVNEPMDTNPPFDLTGSQMASNELKKNQKHFIGANTKEVSLYHLQHDCITPVFAKDNEVTISHNHFIESVLECVNRLFRNERILEPEIRVSHMIKGRTPEALHKPVKELTEADKTIYYERMAFCIEIPSVSESISGNELTLTIGGVRAYNTENLYAKKTFEKFKVFIGFKNMVCLNLCISTDGLCDELRVTNTNDLMAKVVELIASYHARNHLDLMRSFEDRSLTESQFAQFIGKTRLYQNLPQHRKKQLPAMLMTDTQINLVSRGYYQDEAFSVRGQEELSLWNLYNLLTRANKSSYIDNFLDRSLNATQLTEGISHALTGQTGYGWFVE